MKCASTTAIRILATSENWNWRPKIVTQRETPPMPLPIARVADEQARG